MVQKWPRLSRWPSASFHRQRHEAMVPATSSSAASAPISRHISTCVMKATLSLPLMPRAHTAQSLHLRLDTLLQAL